MSICKIGASPYFIADTAYSPFEYFTYVLALFDFENDGIVNPGLDQALFSLSTFSPSTFTYSGLDYSAGVLQHLSPVDIIWTDFNTWSFWASPQ